MQRIKAGPRLLRGRRGAPGRPAPVVLGAQAAAARRQGRLPGDKAAVTGCGRVVWHRGASLGGGGGGLLPAVPNQSPGGGRGVGLRGERSPWVRNPPTTTASSRGIVRRGCPGAWAPAIPSGGRCRTGWCRWAAGAGKPACAWPWASAPRGWSCCGRGAPRGAAGPRRRRCSGRTGAPWRRRAGGSAPGWLRGPAEGGGDTKQGVISDTESSPGLRPWLSASPGARV